MDVLYFLRERTRFISYFYENAAAPFEETMRRIEAEESPFDNPPYDESGEPAFLEEWIEATVALEMLGRSCITMVSASLHLYFRTWERELQIRWRPKERERAFRNGYLWGYRTLFEELLDQPWSTCPADLEVIEQIILARNRDQHPEEITTMRVKHGTADLEKHPRPVFMSESDRNFLDGLDDGESEIAYWLNPSVHVSSDALNEGIVETEKLATWLEAHILAFRYTVD